MSGVGAKPPILMAKMEELPEHWPHIANYRIICFGDSQLITECMDKLGVESYVLHHTGIYFTSKDDATLFYVAAQ